jgi:hypothetical protein
VQWLDQHFRWELLAKLHRAGVAILLEFLQNRPTFSTTAEVSADHFPHGLGEFTYPESEQDGAVGTLAQESRNMLGTHGGLPGKVSSA